MRTKYKVTQYAKQASQSPGVSAGMWAVVRYREEVVAFGDTQGQVEEVRKALKSADATTVADDALF